jgi:anaerobic selenocysteine-containing dehydrogenase
MPMDEVRRHRGVVHEERAIVVQPADPGAAARFTVAPADLMAELAEVRAERRGAEVFGATVPKEYPFLLVSRRLKATLNSLGPELPGLAAKGTTNYAYLHPDDLADLGLVDDEVVEITAPTGSMLGVVSGAPDVRRGVVSMAHSWGGTAETDEKVRETGAPTSRLVSTDRVYDRVTGMVVQSAIPVRVARAAEHAAI